MQLASVSKLLTRTGVTWRLSNGRLEGMNNKIRLLSHRSFGLHSAEALISLVYLNCGGLTLERIH